MAERAPFSLAPYRAQQEPSRYMPIGDYQMPMIDTVGGIDRNGGIPPNIPMDHPLRLQRMEEMLRAGLIPQSTYADYMKMIGK